MKRYLQLQQNLVTNNYNENEWSIDLSIISNDLTVFCCELSLLLFRKAEHLSLIFANGQKLIITATSEDSRVIDTKMAAIEVRLIYRDLELILSYLLAWYRDAIAEVDHIDIELATGNSMDRNCTLVVMADKSKPPLTSDEAMRLLRKFP